MYIPGTLVKVDSNDKILDNKLCRKLFAESSSIFKSIQLTTNKKSDLNKKDLLLYSRKYRCVLQANYLKLREQIENGVIENDEFNQSLYDTFRKIGILWHLCEMLFIDIHQTGILLNQLLTWISWHFDELNFAFDEIIKSENPSNHPEYWNVIYRLVFRREIQHAKNLLYLHPNIKSNDFILIFELLEKMPLYTNEQVLYEFYHAWQSWSIQCKKVYQEHVFINENLFKLAGILCGDLKLFKELRHLFETWYHFMVGMLLYTDPTVKESELTVLTIECLRHFYDRDEYQTKFDGILVSAFSYDLMSVVIMCCSEFQDNWWFVTHFVDLFYQSNQLEQHQVENAKDLRDFFVLEYANNLMCHEVLWNIGSKYYDHSELSNNYLELSLEKIDIRDDLTAKKVLTIAEQHHLKQLQKSIYKILARKWLNLGRYSSALNYAVKSNDETLIAHVCNLFLKHFVKTEEFLDEDLINLLGEHMLKSDRLTFLAKYYEFHQLVENKKVSEAFDLLISLIESKIAPYFFRPKLVIDLIPLIEHDNCKTTQKQISNILSALEEFRNDDKYEYLDENYDLEVFKQKEDILRISIARKMSNVQTFLC